MHQLFKISAHSKFFATFIFLRKPYSSTRVQLEPHLRSRSRDWDITLTSGCRGDFRVSASAVRSYITMLAEATRKAQNCDGRQTACPDSAPAQFRCTELKWREKLVTLRTSKRFVILITHDRQLLVPGPRWWWAMTRKWLTLSPGQSKQVHRPSSDKTSQWGDWGCDRRKTKGTSNVIRLRDGGSCGACDRGWQVWITNEMVSHKRCNWIILSAARTARPLATEANKLSKQHYQPAEWQACSRDHWMAANATLPSLATPSVKSSRQLRSTVNWTRAERLFVWRTSNSIVMILWRHRALPVLKFGQNSCHEIGFPNNFIRCQQISFVLVKLLIKYILNEIDGNLNMI